MAEDYRTHFSRFFSPGLQAVWVHRIGVKAMMLRRPARFFLSAIYLFGHWFCKAIYGIEMQRSVKIGRRFLIGHQGAIVVHQYATFGDDCIIRQGVTLGVGTTWEEGKGPVIGDRVSFSPGCVIVGNVRIGDDVQIGPNCVVTTDVPSDRVLFVAPPRVFPRATDAAGSSEERP
ncbi:serine O-acetyltransferase [Rubrimonas sp.]|uniref:serine O-acetyltransferase n=1 Tax=Rubrimonas sp. TaxID=2036015 RepID=UPI002FDDEAEB